MRRGVTKTAIILVVILFTCQPSGGQSLNNHRYQFKGDEKGLLARAESGKFILNYSLSELDVSTVINEHGSWYRVSIPGHNPSTNTGSPELPVFSRIIAIPEGSGFTIKISDVKSRRIKPSKEKIRGILYPSQEGVIKREQAGKPEFKIDRTLYNSRGIIVSDTVTVEILGKLRSNMLANVTISPVRYNPRANQLELITSMNIEIGFDQISDGSFKSVYPESPLFRESMSKGILNYDPGDVITGFSDQPVKMIIITDTIFRKHLDPLIEWKTQKGYKLNVLYKGLGNTGNTYSEIKDTLNRLYNSFAGIEPYPEYLFIIGDVSRIPMSGSTEITDLYYGEFDGGGDFIPDMYIGRLPVIDTNQLKSAIRKIIQYEKFEFADTNRFYTRALMTAGKDDSYANHMNGQIRYAVENYLTEENNINNYHFYYPDSFTRKDSVMKLIKQGVSFLNYSGHGDKTGWLHLDIKVPDIPKFGNTNMYPFVISNACRTAQFNDSLSFGNKMVVATGRGALGFIGCSNDSYWDEDFYWAVGTGTPSAEPEYSGTGLGAYDRLFHTHGEPPSEWYISMGQVNFAGNLSVSASSSPRKKYYWETYTMLGDPSIIPYIGDPEPFSLNLPDILPEGISSLSLTIDPFAYIAVSSGNTLWDASHASPSGAVILDFPEEKGDSCLIVVTGQNRKPLFKTIYFSEIEEEFINLSETKILDPSGNNNGLADFGELIYLSVKIRNHGQSDTEEISATLTTTSSWATIENGTASIPTLPALTEITLDSEFRIRVDNEVPDQGIITFDLSLTSPHSQKNYRIDVTVHAPRLEIITCFIDDSGTGNNNFTADPGETFDLVFKIRNYGNSSTSGNFSITSISGNLTILEPSVKSGLLQFGEITDIRVPVKLSESALAGDFMSIMSILDCSPYVVNRNYSLRVGLLRESFESTSFNVFPWINLSANPWIVTSANSYDGILAARSGAIPHNASTSLKIRADYSANDTLKFFYRVSSEPNYDYLSFRLNGTEVLKKSGEMSWENKSFSVSAGLNVMEWVYSKDNSVSQGADCAFIDLIDFSVSSPVKYIQTDLELARIVSPPIKDIYGSESVTVKLLNPGRDTINGFQLSFSVNGNVLATQYFNNTLYPQSDSLEVTFNTKVDLSQYGIYDLVVYAYGNEDDYMQNDTLSIVIENTSIAELFNAFPNPFNEKVDLYINSHTTGEAHLTMTNSAGQRVYDRRVELITGENTLTINTHHLSQGVYYLNLTGGNFRKSISLVKIK